MSADIETPRATHLTLPLPKPLRDSELSRARTVKAKHSGSVLFALSRLHCVDGIASHLASLVPFLSKLGWRIWVVVGMVDCPPGAECTLNSIKEASHRFEIDPQLSVVARWDPVYFVRQAIRLKYWARLAEAEIIHIHGRALGPTSCLAKLWGAPPRVYTKHLLLPVNRGMSRALASSILARMWGDRAIAISYALRANLGCDERVTSGNLRYIPHGVDIDHFRPPTFGERAAARRNLGIPEDAVVCLQLARLGPIKRPETLAQACAALRRENTPVMAVFAGHYEPAEAERVMRSVEPDGKRLIRIVGYQDARQAIWVADFCVLCSEREGFPSVIVEAMACGVVPIRTRVEGAFDQIEDGVNGLLFDVGDAPRLALHIKYLLDNPAKWAAMRDAGTRRAREVFSADAMASKTASVYQELIHGFPPDPRTIVLDR